MKPRISPKSCIASVVLAILIGLRSTSSSSISPQTNISSLPGLSERASNGNSRYLSASSTASLAAATVAASNSPQNQQINNNLDINRGYLPHNQQHHTQQNQPAPQQSQQQQQQQQQPQQTTPPSQSPAPSPAAQHQQPVQVAAVSQSPIFGSQSTGIGNTPIMQTTLTYNPLTGQFVPTDIATGNLVGVAPTLNQFLANQLPQQLAQQQSLTPFFTATNIHQQQQQQQQQQLLNNQINPQSSVTYQSLQSSQQPHQGFSVPSSLGGLNAFVSGSSSSHHQGHRPISTQLTRRNGIHQSNRPALTTIFGPAQLGADDDGSLFQQQLGQSSFINGYPINDQIGNSFNVYDGLFGSGNSYQQQQQQQQQQSANSINSQHLLPVGQSSSSSSSQFADLPSQVSPGPSSIYGGYDYRNDQCLAADNRHGTCYQASECIRRGGTPMGRCGSSNQPELSGSSYVCCLFDVTCGQSASERQVYFRNPNYPNTFDQSRMCRAKIGKLDKGICQFRLDLVRFDVAKPTNGNCSTDMFVVSGQNENYVIPKICGFNDGQHYYVGVDESGVITLHMMMMGFYRRSFEILVTQIPCRSDFAAPAHCLQYYMGTHGTIKSFNYDEDNLLGQASTQNPPGYDFQDGSTVSLGGSTAPYGMQFNSNQQRHQHLVSAAQLGGNSVSSRYNVYGLQDQFNGYPNDLDYTMCIRKESGFCSITYQLSRTDSGLQPFAVGHSIFGLNDSSFNQASWHPVSNECRDDYLLIGGVRLCSSGLNQGGDYQALQQFANGSNAAGINQEQLLQQQQELQNQQNLLLQQLNRLKQANSTYPAGAGSLNIANPTQSATSSGLPGSNLANLDQQQAAVMQQLMIVQQQLFNLSASIKQSNQFNQFNNRFNNEPQQYQANGGAIITDTTSGPFLLRFVSNLARNARGFHIDYRQNPCK